MDNNLKLLYISKLNEKRTITETTKYQDGFYTIILNYPLINRRIWLGPYE